MVEGDESSSRNLQLRVGEVRLQHVTEPGTHTTGELPDSENFFLGRYGLPRLDEIKTLLHGVLGLPPWGARKRAVCSSHSLSWRVLYALYSPAYL